jgi:ribonucleoside-diphosphate reductase beta chain
MRLLDTRLQFIPFRYQEAYDYWLKQQQSHWLHTEINLSSDITDWKLNLTEVEKEVIGGVLKGFTQLEVLIGDYWSNKIARRFKHPEIQMMAATFSSFEGIHARSYSILNESLHLDDFEAFLYEPTTKAKLDNLMTKDGKTRKDIAISLAVFSAFAEGVSLFSSFAILLNFSRFNKMKGMGQIISFSIRDESLHSEAGCWLFRKFVEEYPEVLTDEVKKEIYEAARIAVQLEDDFIDKVFEKGTVEGLDPKDLKQFIRHRANVKLSDLGLKANWKNVDKEAVARISSWFDILSSGVEQQDFFALRPSSYSRGVVDWSKTFEEKKDE